MRTMRLLAAFAALAATAAFAQPETALALPARNQVGTVLNLDAVRARQVDAILEGATARLSVVRANSGTSDDRARLALLTALLTIRYETDSQLATVLTPEEFARMKESLYTPQWQRGLPSRGTLM